MKTLLIALCLTLGACASPGLDTVSLSDQGPLARQVSRVLARHDAYVIGDLTLPPEEAFAFLAQADGVRSLALLPEVRRDALGAALEPVAARHDAYVAADLSLDDLRRDTYLHATGQLRRLLGPGE